MNDLDFINPSAFLSNKKIVITDFLASIDLVAILQVFVF